MGSRLAENTTYNLTIRRKMMVFFFAFPTLISWGAAAIVTLRLHMCENKGFFFLLQFMDCRAPISSSYTLKIK